MMALAPIGIICYRKQVGVDEIFVHENFTTSGSKANDIALLRLGDKSIEDHKSYRIICLLLSIRNI